jgi:integrase/recombinase XerD
MMNIPAKVRILKKTQDVNNGVPTPMGHSATLIDNLIQFEIFCGAAESRSNKTLDLTVLVLKKLKAYLETNLLSTDAKYIGPNEIRNFILYLKGCHRYVGHRFTRHQEAPLSPQTINCYYRALRAAWNRWVSDELVLRSPFDKLKAPKFPKKVIPCFTKKQIGDLLAAIDISTPEGYRDYALFLLLLDTGCRLSEVNNLKTNDIDMSRRCIKVMGKGSRERNIPIGAKVLKLLWKYINKYRPEPLLPSYSHVFLTKYGTPLTKNRVEHRMKYYGKKAEISGVRCSPHTLRHTACLFWIRNGGDIFSLQQITGHSSLDVLRGYVNLAQSDISDVHKRCSPVDNLDIKTK